MEGDLKFSPLTSFPDHTCLSIFKRFHLCSKVKKEQEKRRLYVRIFYISKANRSFIFPLNLHSEATRGSPQALSKNPGQV